MTKSELMALDERIRMAEHSYQYANKMLETVHPDDTLRWEAWMNERSKARGAVEALHGLKRFYLGNLFCVGRALDTYGFCTHIYKVTNDG